MLAVNNNMSEKGDSNKLAAQSSRSSKKQRAAGSSKRSRIKLMERATGGVDLSSSSEISSSEPSSDDVQKK